MNKHDSERIRGMLEGLGMLEAATPEESDVVIFVTCCVRESADTKLYGHVMSLRNMPKREGSPLDERIIAVGGCIGQREGKALSQKMDHVNVVFGTRTIHMLPNLIDEAINGSASSNTSVDEGGKTFQLPIHRDASWAAWLPITFGCDNFCTYCIVPYVRGRESSRELEEVIEEAKGYVSDGVKEITLLGQNVNSYGRDLYGSPKFAEMLDAIDATGIERLRFATSHPKDLSDDVIERFASLGSLMPALHLPVQSGSDRVLSTMNRKYTRDHYLALIDKLREANPDIALSTDVIVGFPGETEEDFLDTLSLIDEVGYHQVFTFIYSKRSGTPAASYPDEVPREIAQDRFDRLLSVVEKRALEANSRDVGAIANVLFEGASKKDQGVLTGKTEKNQTVHVAGSGICPEDMAGKIARVKIEEAKTWYLKGQLL